MIYDPIIKHEEYHEIEKILLKFMRKYFLGLERWFCQ